MKLYQFDYETDSQSDIQPTNTHLVIETSGGLLYLVSNADDTKVYGSNDYGATWTQIDVDPSNTSVDNKSRDHSIQSAWHDRTNKIIYFGDCDQPGDTFDVWTLDYSGGFGSESITEVGTSSTYDTDTVYLHDIIRYSSSTYALVSYRDSDVNNTDLMDVSTSSFSIHKAFDNNLNQEAIPFIQDSSKIYNIMYAYFRKVSEISLDTNSPHGICVKDDHFYISSHYTKIIYEYDSSWNKVAQYDSGDYNNGITWDGSYFYALSMDSSVVRKFDTSFNLQDTISIDNKGQCVDWDGTYFYVTRGTGINHVTIVDKYNSSWTLQSSTTLSEMEWSTGIFWDGTYFYVVDTNKDKIFKYNSDFSTLIDSYYTGFTNSTPYGIVKEGDFFYILDGESGTFKYIEKTVATSEYDFSTDSKSLDVVYKDVLYLIPSSVNRQFLAYDNSDNLYYVLQKESDSNYYLQQYEISTSTNTEIAQYDIALMLDRNNAGTEPSKQEKGFEINTSKVYKLTRSSSGVHLYQDISYSDDFTSGSYVIAITDNYLFVNNDGTIEIWVLTDISGELWDMKARLDIQRGSEAKFKADRTFPSNQVFEIYDDNTSDPV